MTPSRGAASARALLLTLMLMTGCGDGGDVLDPPLPPSMGASGGAGSTAGVAICAGNLHTCVITEGGQVACAGLGLDGQLGSAEHRTRRSFAAVPGVEGATSLACGSRHTCVTTRAGALFCWGEAASEQLGVEDATLGPVQVPGVTGAVQVAAGDAFTCVRTREREVYCLGALPEPEEESTPSGEAPADDGEVLANTAALQGVIDIAAGSGHLCVLLEDGTLRCRGDNRAGQLGVAPTRAEGWTETRLEGVVDVEAGGALTCGRLREGGELRCFGAGSQGQLGDGMRSAASFIPVPVKEVRDAHALSIGSTHACAIVGAAHTLTCWGESSEDRLGSPTVEGQGPTVVRGLEGAIRVATGGAHSCAITHDGSLWCWGRSREGQLGISGYDPVRTARRIGALRELTATPSATGTPRSPRGSNPPSLAAALSTPATRAIVTGADHVCVLGADGGVSCWGSGELGQLGHGRSDSSFERSVRVVGLEGVVALSAGANHTCALLADARVACWGEQEGGFGDGSGDPSSLPVEVHAFRGARAVSAGDRMTCALLGDGSVRCSGAALFESHERLAARTAGRGLGVRTITGLTEPSGVAVGSALGCAIVADGRVSCWGPTPGRATTEARQVRGLAGAVQLDIGHRTGCAASRGGRISCWEVPLGSVAPITSELVNGLTFVDRVVVGEGVFCAKPRRGGYLCWGENRLGQTGTGLEAAMVRSPSPLADTAVTDQGRRASLDCSDGFCCGLHPSGAISCAGAGPLVHLASRDSARPRTPLMVPFRADPAPPAEAPADAPAAAPAVTPAAPPAPAP
ncbi:MAG: hypothetical protein IPI43_32945 [Sandaracinaceae bacterium]|nr:hypothetical protein [Sandaracinaceae bacterium]MBK7778869.1 hypothetical protein [Sandaracinaceae bacterium]